MPRTNRRFGLPSFLSSSRIVVFSIVLFCAFTLIGTAAEGVQKKGDSNERLIRFANSPVRVVLKGNDTYRISLDGRTFSRELPQKHHIRLRGMSFDPVINPPQLVGELPRGEALYIVQCVAQAIVPFQEQITAAGGEICGTLPDNALLVVMDRATGAGIENLSFVRWVGLYQPSYKLAGQLRENLSRPMNNGNDRYSIYVAKKTKKKDVQDYITSLGGEVVLKTKSRRFEAKLDQGQLQKVTEQAWVLAVDPWTPKENDMNIVRDIGGANYLETVEGYTGQGVRAEVCDGGLRATHDDFQANPPVIHGGNSSSTSHGTPVTGIVFGSGAANSDARGMIPDAEQPIFSAYNSFTDRYAHTQELVNPSGSYRAVFQTNSWGNTRTLDYTTISAEMDEIIFDLDLLITQSQSNAGDQWSRPQAWAKNIVSIGGLRHYDTLSRSDDCWCSSASIGPAEDGRIKPDLWHFYDYTLAPYYTSDTSYTEFGGTSGATPVTAGHFGLLFQMWGDGVFNGGPGQARDVFNYRPHATTAKALMIHSAYQYPFSGTNDDKTRVHQGWGMADVQSLYDMAQGNGWTFPILVDESAVIAPLATHGYNLNVTGSGPLKATLVFADPPGVPGAAVQRINDLSLKVTSPTGTIYWGNNGLLSGLWSSSGGSSNTIDTVENVFIQSPESGTWTIEVLADEVVQDGHVETPAIDADYALIASGGDTAQVDPPAAPTALGASAIACDQIDISWTDNADNESSFKIERSTDGTNFSQIGTTGANVTSYSDTTVAESTTYWYQVRASNSGGDSAYTNTANATTPACPALPPAAPSGLTGKGGKNKVKLAWTDNANDEDGFRIYRGTTTSNMVQVAVVGANVTKYEDTGLARKTYYYHKVCAYNANGEGCSGTIYTKAK